MALEYLVLLQDFYARCKNEIELEYYVGLLETNLFKRNKIIIYQKNMQ